MTQPVFEIICLASPALTDIFGILFNIVSATTFGKDSDKLDKI